MIILPREDDLLNHVRASLDDVGNAELELSTPDWFGEIASKVATKVSPIGLKCYARGQPPPCAGGEFLWDFSAFIYDEEVPEGDRFEAQAAIVGEVEWSGGGIDHDFAKLLCADALVCFMTFQKRTVGEAKQKLDWLETAVRRRQGYARLRGLTRPPAFLLSCWLLKENRFEHATVLPAAAA